MSSPLAFMGWHRAGIALLSLLFVSAVQAADPLTLGEAVTLAVNQDPGTKQIKAESQALSDQAVSAGQWPDPKVSLGLVNLPTNSYAVGRDSMTMQMIGVEQDFPAGDTRSLANTRGQQLTAAQSALVTDRKLQVIREVREAWLKLYYAEHALPYVQQSEQSFQQLLDIAKVRYANGQGGEQDLSRAELELGSLQERELELNADIDSARADLSKLVGAEDGARPLADGLPVLPEPPDHASLLQGLPRHPRIVAANTQVAAAETATDIAKQAYKPMWGVSLSYGKRPGADSQGVPYTNMVTAMVSFSVPLFTGNRQDRSVSAAESESNADRYTVDDTLRDMRQMLDMSWAHWDHLSHIRELYAKTLQPTAGLNTQATLSAYKNGTADFDELVRAQITELDTRVEQLKADTDFLSMQADLLYLSGEQP